MNLLDTTLDGNFNILYVGNSYDSIMGSTSGITVGHNYFSAVWYSGERRWT